jgi:uncharacterized membrane protein YbhN (UPF0104 family)
LSVVRNSQAEGLGVKKAKFKRLHSILSVCKAMQRSFLRFFQPLKPWLKWLILGATIAFLGDQLRRYGAEMLTLPLTASSYAHFGLALGITIAAHLWAGVAWGWILAYLNYPQPHFWSMGVYLRTNIAKYLPGNIWHFVSRVRDSQAQEIPLGISVLSVVLEAFLMMAAASILALGSSLPWFLRGSGIVIVLSLLHPYCLSPILQRLERSKRQQLQENLAVRSATDGNPPGNPFDSLSAPPLHYPWQPLGGELLFVLLRSIGFLTIVLALHPLAWDRWGSLISGFSVAWVLGLVIPGAPGGLGVFEATAILLLEGFLPASVVLATVTIYRVMSTLAEAIGAGLGYAFPKH